MTEPQQDAAPEGTVEGMSYEERIAYHRQYTTLQTATELALSEFGQPFDDVIELEGPDDGGNAGSVQRTTV